MKSPKNRKKWFRVDCGHCHATQNSLLFACGHCKQRLYTNMEADELGAIGSKVDGMEMLLEAVEHPASRKGSPYQPLDQAWETYRALRTHAYLPGMTAYLDSVLAVLLPIKLRLLQRTVKANWVFFGVLVAFPLVAGVFGMGLMMVGLLALPAVAWMWVAFKAVGDLKKAKSRLAQITAPCA